MEAKLSTLTREFDDLREKSSALAFWNSLFWEKDTATRQNWILADAWYRSRCLELPRAGDAMVPGLDMVNHSHHATAYYEEDDQDGVVLILRPGVEVTGGEEVTITYGEAKSAAEMLFSYGFIDLDSATHELVLPLDSMPDDPLGKAKLHAFEGRPTLKLSRTDGGLQWSSPFAYFMCLNEEDGLDFGVLQGTDGERQLRLFWQEEDVTGRAHEFETLIEGHPLQQVFKLRVVAVLHELVSTQLMHLGSDFSLDQLEPLRRSGQVREECIRAAGALRELETSVLEIAAERLDEQVREDVFFQSGFFGFPAWALFHQHGQVADQLMTSRWHLQTGIDLLSFPIGWLRPRQMLGNFPRFLTPSIPLKLTERLRILQWPTGMAKPKAGEAGNSTFRSAVLHVLHTFCSPKDVVSRLTYAIAEFRRPTF